MSSLFNYELDERQIKILMQDSESEYDESLWQKFNELPVCESKLAIDINKFSPKINISRSVFVPIVFVVIIGGLSSLLFSFIDFKKKETIHTEIPLIADPENYNKTNPQSIQKTKSIIAKKIQVTSPKKDSVKLVESNSAIKESPVVELKKENPSKKAEIIQSDLAVKKESTSPSRKKSNRIHTQELPAIKTITSLNEEVKEPELDLR